MKRVGRSVGAGCGESGEAIGNVSVMECWCGSVLL